MATSRKASDRRSTVTVLESVAYSLSYPAHWGPSTNTYANAFELRNYGPNVTVATPERNRASVVVVYTIDDTAEAAQRYFDGLGGSRFELAGHPAKRTRHRVAPEGLGPGMRRADGEEDVGGAPDHWVISTHVVNGRVLLAIEGRAPVTADAEVLAEILRIEDSIRFVSAKKEEGQ